MDVTLHFNIDELICIPLISNAIDIFLQGGFLMYFSLHKLFVSFVGFLLEILLVFLYIGINPFILLCFSFNLSVVFFPHSVISS